MFLLLSVFLLSITVFGQSSEGFYRARFISLDRSVNPVAEFVIQSNGTVTGKIIVNESATVIRGQVDADGNLEARSGSESRTNYMVKADMRRGGKITLTSRSETNTAGNRNNSQAFMQGSYSKIANPAAQNLPVSPNKKSELTIEQPNPLFENTFTSAQVKVIVEKNSSFNLYHLQMMGGEEMDEHGFYFSIARPQDSDQKIWKAENIRALNYVEKTGYDKKASKYANINRFRADYEMWLKNRTIYSGEIELVSENNRQMVFKINNLKIKNEANNDFVTLNGIVYAEISY